MAEITTRSALLRAALALLAGAGIACSSPAAASQAGTDASRPQTSASELRPGEYLWLPEAAPEGPLLLLVSLTQQRAHLYRNGLRLAISTISSGRPGYETPPGVYAVLQKREEHYSNLYDDAPMPYMQRLTWSGLALHAGTLPGNPASHGCIRLPWGFARRLFEISSVGMTVVVMNQESSYPEAIQPGWLAEIANDAAPLDPADGEYWRPEHAPSGVLTLLVSLPQRMILVLRGGIVIGRAYFQLEGTSPAGLQVLQLETGTEPEASAYVPGALRLRWRRLALTEQAFETPRAQEPLPDLYGRVRVAPEFARNVYATLLPGSVVVITDEAISPPTDVGAIMEAAGGQPLERGR